VECVALSTLIQWHSVTSQNTYILNNTAVRTSHFATCLVYSYMHSVDKYRNRIYVYSCDCVEDDEDVMV